MEMRVREAFKRNEENSRKLKDVEKRLEESITREREYKIKYHELLEKSASARTGGPARGKLDEKKKSNRFEDRNKEEGADEPVEESMVSAIDPIQRDAEVTRLRAQVAKLERDLKSQKGVTPALISE